MSQRTRKVQSVIQQVVATQLLALDNAAQLTVTAVDASPDLRRAIVWIDVLAGTEEQRQVIFDATNENRRDIQAAVASTLTTKFIPKLELRLDRGGQHADHINRLINNL